MCRPTWLLRLFPWALAIAALSSFLLSSNDLFAQDDHGNYNTVATPLIIGAPAVSGSIDQLNGQADNDWFSFQAQRGTLYTVELERLDLVNVHVEVMNSGSRGYGRSPGQETEQHDRKNTISWIARTSETYFVRVAGQPIPDGNGHYLGSYTLRIFADTTMTDLHQDVPETATPLDAGNVYRGAVSPWTDQFHLTGSVHGSDDADYFVLQARRGIRYSVEVEPGTLDGVSITLIKADEEIIVTNGGEGDSVTWTSPASIRVYVRISGTNRVRNPQGTYSLRLETETDLQDRYAETRFSATEISFGNAHPGAISPADDQDWFEFSAERGVRYILNATLGTAQAVELAIWDQDSTSKRLASNAGVGDALEFVAPSTGRYFIAASGSTQVPDVIGTYSLVLTSVDTLRDRHGDSASRATAVVLRTPNQGAISPEDDLDFFSFLARRGVTYAVRLEAVSGEDASISIEDPDGEILVTNGGVGQEVSWTATTNGRQFITVAQAVRADNPIGTYTMTVRGDDDLQDRHGEDYSSGTRISFGTTYQGAISPEDDRDFFTFAAERGAEYFVEVKYGTVDALGLLVNTQGGSPSTAIRNFGDTNTLTWIPWVNGAYFIEVSSSPRSTTTTGTYTLQVTRDVSTHDRHSDSSSGATRIGLRNAIAGAVSPADDRDYFYFSARGGETYRVDVTLGTAEAVRFSVEGAGVEFATSNFGVGNSLEWTAPVSGGYILSVSASGQVDDPIGTYQVTINPEGEPRLDQPGSEPPLTPESPPSVEEDPALPALVVDSWAGQPGSTVQVPVLLRRIEGVTTLEFRLGYNPAVLRVARVLQGSRFARGTFVDNSDTPGQISVGVAASGDTGLDGSVAVVEFGVIGQIGETSPLVLSGLEISLGSAGAPEFPLVSGEFRVESPIPGDGDGDGSITVRDALIALKASAAGSQDTPWLDLDGDGQVTDADVDLILVQAQPEQG